MLTTRLARGGARLVQARRCSAAAGFDYNKVAGRTLESIQEVFDDFADAKPQHEVEVEFSVSPWRPAREPLSFATDSHAWGAAGRCAQH